jgi:phospholipase/carboxylesterase
MIAATDRMATRGRSPSLSLVHLVREPKQNDRPRPPLLLLLHGVGSNEHSMARHADAFDDRFLVVSARSPLEFGPESFGWFHVSFTADGPVIVANEAEAGWKHIAGFIDEVVDAYDVDRERVFVSGFSQGAIMALATLLTSPDRVAGVAAMSGRLLPEVLPHAAPAEKLRGKPVLIVHGRHDERLGVHFARSAREKLAAFPIEMTYEEIEIGHRMTPESIRLVADWLSRQLSARSAAH